MIKFDEYGNLANIDGQYSNLHLKHVIHGYAKNDRPEEGVLLVFTEEGRSYLHVLQVYQKVTFRSLILQIILYRSYVLYLHIQ